MNSILAMDLEEIPYLLIVLLVSFTLHELAHAFTAYKLGDPTPKMQGRITLNPQKHLDPIGFISIFLIGFGWAKPVEINPDSLKNPNRDDILISLAGPMANLIIVLFSFIFWYGAIFLNIESYLSKTTYDFLYTLFDEMVYMNIILFIFNLLPIPPLDGFHIFKNLFLSENLKSRIDASQGIISVMIMVLFASSVADPIINPIFNSLEPGIFKLFDSTFAKLFGLT